MVKIILFVCKHNRFRSRVAEAFFNKINKNKKYVGKSAGVINGGYPLNKNQIDVAREFGITIDGKPQGISLYLLKKQNILVIVADDVPMGLFNTKNYRKEGYIKKIISWKINDTINGKENSKEEIRKIIKIIENKVKGLVEELR